MSLFTEEYYKDLSDVSLTYGARLEDVLKVKNTLYNVCKSVEKGNISNADGSTYAGKKAIEMASQSGATKFCFISASYYSTFCRDLYKLHLSAFKPVGTTVPNLENNFTENVIARKPFSWFRHEHIVAILCLAAKKETSGIIDMLWMIPDNILTRGTATSRDLLKILLAMEVTKCEPFVDSNGGSYKLTLECDFGDQHIKKECYATETSPPQLATDAFAFGKKGKDFLIPLNMKRTNPISVTVLNDDGSRTTIVCKDKGPEGTICMAGEHAMGKEIKVLAENQHRLFEEGKGYMEIPESALKDLTIRCLAEETGDLPIQKSFMLEPVSEEEERDIRYWVNFIVVGDTVYIIGYPRFSVSFVTINIFDANAITNESLIPSDIEEVTKPVLVPFNDVVRNFKVGGKYSPAFPSHVKMLEMVQRFLQFGPV